MRVFVRAQRELRGNAEAEEGEDGAPEERAPVRGGGGVAAEAEQLPLRLARDGGEDLGAAEGKRRRLPAHRGDDPLLHRRRDLRACLDRRLEIAEDRGDEN